MQILSVSQFLAYVNDTFKAIWDPTLVAVEGEVSGFRISQGQWVNFDVKDKEALVSVFMVLRNLALPIQDGMRVRLFGYPRIYPKYGKFSFNADRVELVGEGTLRKALAFLREKLDKEGLFDPSRKRSLPRFPQRIALIASRDSAAYGDFVRIVNERWGGVQIDLYHVVVQGPDAPASIIRAIQATQDEPYDVLVLTRGGGSFEELMAFNDEALVRAIYASRIPTLVAIGHERDLSLAEEAADVRGSTPTDCARRLVPDRHDILYQISQSQEAIAEKLSSLISDWHREIDDRLTSTDHWLTRMRDRSDALFRLFASYDPKSVVRRGYAIVRDQKGRVRVSTEDLASGDQLNIGFRDGSADTVVKSVYGEKEAGN
jgi:exodeoxyribonuclease VII large subunit